MKFSGVRSTGPATRLVRVLCSCFHTILIWWEPLFLNASLVVPEFPGTSGHRCVHSSVARYEAVCISAHQADSGSSVQGEGQRYFLHPGSQVLTSGLPAEVPETIASA